MDARNAAARETRFARLLETARADNPFYRAKLAPHIGTALPALADIADLPCTEKSELVDDQARTPPFGINLTYPIEYYTRVHQTSGTTGTPLRWLDTAASWEWWLACWRAVYAAAGVGSDDRVFVAFSFGPFIGFWSAFEAAQSLGALTLPGGGMTSAQRVHALAEQEATVLVCTPTYALHLASVARGEGVDLASGSVRTTIHAGEPGASVPNVRARLESLWGARCFDHAGATEIGAWGYGCGELGALHVNEDEFVIEVLDPDSGDPVVPRTDGKTAGELVLTNLGRLGSPVIRYRTGDRVVLDRAPCACGRPSAVLRGGVLGRADDMVIVRGVNIFPSAVDDVVRGVPEIDEYQVEVDRSVEMAELVIRIETDDRAAADTLVEQVRRRLGLRPRVERVDAGSLPRFELKARRFVN